MMIYEIFQYSLISIATILIGYQLILIMMALISKKNEPLDTVYNRSFLIIIPSHNKGKDLAQTLYSLFGLMYPWNLYKLVILADNCTDNTVGIAQKFGLQVLERHNNDANQQGGNIALGWAFEQIWQWDEKYDAIVIIEPGSLVSGNFLKVMNHYIEKGSEVIKSSNLVLDRPKRWKTEVGRITHLLHNHVNPLGRKALGLNMSLSGNGMCYRSHLLNKYPIANNSMAEEWEYSLLLSLKGIHIDFAPEARVWYQLPGVSSKSELDYAQPIGVRYSIIKKYTKYFFIYFFTKRSIQLLEALLGFVTPHTLILFLGILGILAINVILWTIGVVSELFVWVWLALYIMEGIYFCTVIVADRVMRTYLNGK